MTGGFSFVDDFSNADPAGWAVHLSRPDGFNSAGTGAYSEIGRGENIRLVEADRGKALQVRYAANEDRGQAVVDLPDGGADYVRTQQSMKFGDTFDFGFGQKIHRIWGMNETGELATFDIVVIVWAKPQAGRGEFDLTGVNDSAQVSINYNGPASAHDWGADWADFSFTRGRWYDIVTEIKLNDPGQANGEARVFIDGVKVLERTQIRIRDAAAARATHVLFGGWYSNSAAGRNPAPDPAAPTTLWIDDVSITTNSTPLPAAPQISISDTTIVEGTISNGGLKNASFTITATTTADDFAPVRVQWQTIDGTAKAGSDYLTRSGEVTLRPDSRTATILVPVIADRAPEISESFVVRLSNAVNGNLADAEGTGTISNDDFSANRSLVRVWRPSTGTWYEKNLVTGATTSRQLGLPTDVPVDADFNGDGRVDMAVWRPNTAQWFVQIDGVTQVRTWGRKNDIPVVADFNGDGRADLGIYRPSNRSWWIANFHDLSIIRAGAVFGKAGDVPVVADYNGDGRAEIAVYRRSNGSWWAMDAVNWGTWIVPGRFATAAPQANDIPAPGDYDGDGSTDLAVWNEGTGVWKILLSRTNQAQTIQWGISEDRPQPSDYDGDGRTDIAVWRNSTGVWHVATSSNGSQAAWQWGLPGDWAVYDVSRYGRRRIWGRA